MLKSWAVALLMLSLGGIVLPGTAHAANDALTEDSSTRTKTRDARQYTDRYTHRCRARELSTSLRVTCQSGGYATFVYPLRVPGKAINMRPGVSASKGVEVEGYRTTARRYAVHVGVSGKGTYTIEAAILRMDIPTTYDSRPCVTAGEWARINVWMGGFGGTLAGIAAVAETNGRRTFISRDYDGFRYQVRAYKRCGLAKTRKVTFHHHSGSPGWHSYWG